MEEWISWCLVHMSVFMGGLVGAWLSGLLGWLVGAWLSGLLGWLVGGWR